jgi:hypothetical protein
MTMMMNCISSKYLYRLFLNYDALTDEFWSRQWYKSNLHSIEITLHILLFHFSWFINIYYYKF